MNDHESLKQTNEEIRIQMFASQWVQNTYLAAVTGCYKSSKTVIYKSACKLLQSGLHKILTGLKLCLLSELCIYKDRLGSDSKSQKLFLQISHGKLWNSESPFIYI